MKTMKTLRSQSGFSLIELMVVVAIIGILATMSVGAVQKQIGKARQAEAKSNLGGLYTSEKSFQAEYDSFCSDWGSIGFGIEGSSRYGVGFSAVHLAVAAVPGSGVSNNMGGTLLAGATAPTATSTAAGAFVAGANSTHYKGFMDRWQINESKALTQTENALAGD